ncbi:MAG: Fic family protein [Clostridium sp.]|nr:Fic family protein [Clostridium sp.]MCM1460567.1 Fic family protein [Bacteroides sp.]
MVDNNWQMDLEEYIRQGEPEQADKSLAWKTAIGLQDVDGLKTSEYLLETAKEHIEGKIDIATAQRRVKSYYEERLDRKKVEVGTMEADIVSTRITELLSEKTFQFSPVEWKTIHRRLFSGIFDYAGQFRTYNITKKEWVLKGKTVYYSSYESIKETLDYDFKQEKEFSYEGLTTEEAVRHIAKFTAGIWQIHPFCEGNTRSTAVFVLKYLRTFGFALSNDVFAENSWYFRNALVRANYNDIQNGVSATTQYLELFFENLLLGKKHELKNRYLHVEYLPRTEHFQEQSARMMNSKCQNGTLNCTLEEIAILNLIKENPKITQKEIAEKTAKSERSIKRRTVELQEKGILRRENGKRNGRWEITGK